MSDWTAGNIDGIAYTYGYCDELNPLRLPLPLLQSGFAPPTVRTACELGYGHGVSVNLHAAGSDSRWFGTDFNAAHARFAQQLAQQAGSQATLCADSFAAFCARDDLPNFDFIGLHGIWSWVADEHRACLAEFIERKLNHGGVVYVSYNTEPGWAAMLPVRELLRSHFHAGAQHASPGEASDETRALSQVAQSVAFLQRVMAAQPGYAQANPQLAARIDALSDDDAHYLAHEYFNRDWQPLTFSQVAATFGACGLRYAGSADYRDHVDEINLTPAQRALLTEIDDPVVRETTRDFCTLRSMRRDYWIKGAPALGAEAREAALRAQRVMLALPREAVQLKVRGALGEAALPVATYGPILDALAGHRPTSLAEIERHAHGLTFDGVVKAVTLLVGSGVLLNVQDDARIAAARSTSAQLNAAICEQAPQRGDVQFLVSPVSGSGVRVPRVAQLFLLARQRGFSEPTQWAAFAEAALDGQESSQALQEKAQRFADMHVPILQALGIA
ncbi:methyltransferase regulatory domain-containing protein [Burkholderia sp. 22PA0099]|uniref:class I SAM-dependent methyltransferase n=1 Tax=Burkholderia sp. 22PA0099 TaxID=3237372 RepID=UPI0039C3C8A4